jgi:hypothetical protein
MLAELFIVEWQTTPNCHSNWHCIQLNWIGLWRLRTGADRQHGHVFGRQSDCMAT